MTKYANHSGNSNVLEYENGNGYIKILFASGEYSLYTYTDGSAGSSAINKMKSLAIAGQGLNSYVSTNKPNYESKS